MVTLSTKAIASIATRSARPAAGWIALGAVAGPILFTLGWFALGFISPGYTMWGIRIAPYSAISQPLSGLGLGPTGPFMNATFILSGLLMVCGAVGIFRSIGGRARAAPSRRTRLRPPPRVRAATYGGFTPQ